MSSRLSRAVRVAMMAVLVVAAWPGAPVLAGSGAGNCQPDAASCPAVGWGTSLGTLSVSVSGGSVSASASNSYPPQVWLPTDSGPVASGAGSVSLSAAGQLVDYSPKAGPTISVSVNGGTITWTGIETNQPGTGVPTSRFPVGSTFSASWSFSGTPNGLVDATFNTNYGYTHWADDAWVNLGKQTPAALSLSASTDHLWGNGRDQATLNVQGPPGTSVTLGAQPATNVTLGTTSLQTDSAGHASTSVTGAMPVSPGSSVPVTFTASATSGGTPLSAQTQIRFTRHTVVVLAQGINSALVCADVYTCSPESQLHATSSPSPDPAWQPLLQALTAQGIGSQDQLWYSYAGGGVVSTTGRWSPNPYLCGTTKQAYDTSIGRLNSMLQAYTRANPNVDISVIGHSQGGLLIFQALGDVKAIEAQAPTARLAHVVTLDSPLGGEPLANAAIAALATCWGEPALSGMVGLWNTTSAHAAQGSRATLLCAFDGVCLDAIGHPDNHDIVQLRASDTGVTTYGSTDDAVYNPAACLGASAAGLLKLLNVTPTEVVDVAGGGLAALGGNTSHDPSACSLASHTAVITAEASAVAQVVGPQQH